MNKVFQLFRNDCLIVISFKEKNVIFDFKDLNNDVLYIRKVIFITKLLRRDKMDIYYIFQVWNIVDLFLVYQFIIIIVLFFISMSMNFYVFQVVIGIVDGIVRVYDLFDGKDFRCVY